MFWDKDIKILIIFGKQDKKVLKEAEKCFTFLRNAKILKFLRIKDVKIPGLPEPPFSAGARAGAVYLVRLLLLLYCKYFFLRDLQSPR